MIQVELCIHPPCDSFGFQELFDPSIEKRTVSTYCTRHNSVVVGIPKDELAVILRRSPLVFENRILYWNTFVKQRIAQYTNVQAKGMNDNNMKSATKLDLS